MSTVRVGLLVCDHVDDHFRHIAGDYTDMFASLLAPWAEVVPFDVVAGEMPSSPSACDAWVATGSRRSVFDDADWIERGAAFVRSVRDAGTPYVGVCFGHQLLAHALGGCVQRATVGWGAGVHRTVVAEPAAWMDPPLAECRLLYMHQDQVVSLPPGAEVVARTDHCPVAMFEVGGSMLGMQAHPEFPAAYVAALLHDRAERIGETATDAALRSLDQPIDAGVVGHWLASFLAQGVR